MIRSVVIAAASIIACATLSGCTANRIGSPVQTSAQAQSSVVTTAASMPAPGLAEVSLNAPPQSLRIQSCSSAAGGQLIVVAGAFQALSTLMVAHVAQQASGSTLVATSVRADRSYDTFSLAAIKGNLVSGDVSGTSITLKGMAVEQAYTAAGKPTGPSKAAQISMGATCASIQPAAPISLAAPTHASSTIKPIEPTGKSGSPH